MSDLSEVRFIHIRYIRRLLYHWTSVQRNRDRTNEYQVPSDSLYRGFTVLWQAERAIETNDSIGCIFSALSDRLYDMAYARVNRENGFKATEWRSWTEIDGCGGIGDNPKQYKID